MAKRRRAKARRTRKPSGRTVATAAPTPDLAPIADNDNDNAVDDLQGLDVVVDKSATTAQLLDAAVDMLTDGPVEPASQTRPVADGVREASIELLEATADGPESARRVAGELDDVGGVLMFCIPENWHTPETLDLCRRLASDDAAAVLTWLSLNWHAGYAAGVRDGQQALADAVAADVADAAE